MSDWRAWTWQSDWTGLIFFVSTITLISFLLFPCASVWEDTRAWVLFSYSHILDGTFLFRDTTWSKWSESRLSMANYNNNSMKFCCGGQLIIFSVMFFSCLPENHNCFIGLEVAMPVMICMFFCCCFHILQCLPFQCLNKQINKLLFTLILIF